jgi:hypothetical protein
MGVASQGEVYGCKLTLIAQLSAGSLRSGLWPGWLTDVTS